MVLMNSVTAKLSVSVRNVQSNVRLLILAAIENIRIRNFTYYLCFLFSLINLAAMFIISQKMEFGLV